MPEDLRQRFHTQVGTQQKAGIRFLDWEHPFLISCSNLQFRMQSGITWMTAMMEVMMGDTTVGMEEVIETEGLN
jgi:hypothetical protein